MGDERVLYTRTWDNLLPKRLRLDELDFREGAPEQSFALGEGQWAEDMRGGSTLPRQP